MLPELYLHLHHQRERELTTTSPRAIKSPVTFRKRARRLSDRITLCLPQHS